MTERPCRAIPFALTPAFRSCTCPLGHHHAATHNPIHHRLSLRAVYEEEGPLAPAGVPTRNPLENLRETVLRYRMRPVPVVFLRLAFSPQLTARSVSAWPSVAGGGRALEHTLPGLSSRVAAGSASVLLDVEGATTCHAR
jgi:hypothetical protein